MPYTELPNKRPTDNCIPSLWGTLILIKSNATNYLKPFSQIQSEVKPRAALFKSNWIPAWEWTANRFLIAVFCPWGILSHTFCFQIKSTRMSSIRIVPGLSWSQNFCIMKYVSMFWNFHSLLILLIVNLSSQTLSASPDLLILLGRKTGNKRVTLVHRTCRRRMKPPMKGPVILLLSGSTA